MYTESMPISRKVSCNLFARGSANYYILAIKLVCSNITSGQYTITIKLLMLVSESSKLIVLWLLHKRSVL